jgi:Flp pilus assembly pilin Flp
MIDTDIQTTARTGASIVQENGQALVEYGLILMFISVTAIALTPVGQWLAVRMSDLAAAV